ncbi:MAG: SGNH/GDSL hydrolase family protein [Opitutales bacterium]
MTQARPIYLVPIGDSITQGGIANREEYAYRYALYYLLREHGYAVDFIGSLTTGLQPGATWPDQNGVPFDHDHEGVYGIRTAAALERLPAAIEQWAHPPDIALIHLGTNDQRTDDPQADIIEPLTQIIGLVRQQNPKVILFVAHIHFTSPMHVALRPHLDEMVEALDTPESPVAAIRSWEGFNADPDHPQTDTFDWAHPNPAGQLKYAQKWFAAMRPHLDRLKTELEKSASPSQTSRVEPPRHTPDREPQ